MAESPNEVQAQFALQRIYVKDLSFESPKAPEIFQKQWKPEVKLDLNTKNCKLEDNLHEVVLSLVITVVNGEEKEKHVTFIVEVEQAGVFFINGLEEEELHRTLGAFCPNILFPYAREAIDNVVTRGSFPPIMLSPVNFDAIYQQAREQNESEDNQSEYQVH